MSGVTTPPKEAMRGAGAERVISRSPGRAERDPGAFARRRRVIEVGLGIGVPTALLVLWQLAATNGWISRINYPAPSDIASHFRKLFRHEPGGNFGADVGASIVRTLWGFAWGAAAGLILGFVMGMNRLVRAALNPMLNALYTVPKVALIGVFLFIFGFDDKPVIAVVAVTVFFFVWIQSMAAVISVAENYREAARSFGATRFQQFRHVILPATLPQVFVGLRVAAGVAVLTVIAVEFAFAPQTRGVGYRINNARNIFDPKQAYVGLVVAALMGVVFSALVTFVGRRLTPWAKESNDTPS